MSQRWGILFWGGDLRLPRLRLAMTGQEARNDREKNLAMMNKRSAMITKGAVK